MNEDRKRSATDEMEGFVKPGDRNRPKGLNPVADDDKTITLLLVLFISMG
jgi:hypothetical protein